MNTNEVYKTASEYNKAVQQWVWQYHMYTNMMWMHSMMPFLLNNTMSICRPANISTPGSTATQNTTTNSQNQGVRHRVTPIVPPPINQGVEFRVPPLWKRVVAEFIDFILLFLIKLGVTLLTVEYVGGIEFERYDIEMLFDENLD